MSDQQKVTFAEMRIAKDTITKNCGYKSVSILSNVKKYQPLTIHWETGSKSFGKAGEELTTAILEEATEYALQHHSPDKLRDTEEGCLDIIVEHGYGYSLVFGHPDTAPVNIHNPVTNSVIKSFGNQGEFPTLFLLSEAARYAITQANKKY